MLATTIIVIAMCAGSASRWIAYRERVTAPRRYPIGSLRWFFPPFPLEGEFRTPRSRRLDVAGSILLNIGAVLVFGRLLVDIVG